MSLSAAARPTPSRHRWWALAAALALTATGCQAPEEDEGSAAPPQEQSEQSSPAPSEDDQDGGSDEGDGGSGGSDEAGPLPPARAERSCARHILDHPAATQPGRWPCKARSICQRSRRRGVRRRAVRCAASCWRERTAMARVPSLSTVDTN